jgi:RsiW-degrading membrane proteinase PrsW (M82 family)
VTILTDAEKDTLVDELITWPSTLALMQVDPENPGTPSDVGTLDTQTETLPDGTTARYWEGTREAIFTALKTWNVDADHKVVAEAVYTHATNNRFRTRVVWARAKGEFTGALLSWGDGGSLRLRAPAGTPASVVLASLEARIAKGSTYEVFVRGRTSLGQPRIEGDAAYLSFGDGIEAYVRAEKEKRLLATATLPQLKRISAAPKPRERGLETACFVVPVLLSLAWLFVLRRFDRAHPEPLWLIAVTFFFGALSTLPASLLELAFASLSPWLDPRVVTFGGQLFAFPLAWAVFTLVVGMSEEGAKLLGATFASRRREFDEPVDGIVYGIVSSLGFAAAENARYFTMTRLEIPVVVGRAFMSVPAHMFFGAIWGYAMGARLVDKRIGVGWFLVAAAAAHGLFDALLSTDGGAAFAIALNVVLASVFVVLLRRALTHGVIDRSAHPVERRDRHFFRAGRPNLFLLCALGLHVAAFGLVVLGSGYAMTHVRPSAAFVAASSTLLALLATAAFGLPVTMPLDIAVDAYGVTFAGAARPWSRIKAFRAKARHVELVCDTEPLLLGPCKGDVLTSLVRELDARTRNTLE